MKTIKLFKNAMFLFLAMLLSSAIFSQASSKDRKIVSDANYAKAQFTKGDASMSNLFNSSYGYAIFPNVGKGAIGIGGAAGNGAVYEQGKLIGMSNMKQVSIGFQWGGQAYREIIFFETKADLDRFVENKFDFSAQVSAVAVTAGASANVKFKNGVLVFTQTKGGLMYEASVGGQKFKFRKI